MELSKSWQLVAETSYQVTTNTKGYARLYMKYGNRETETLLDTIYFEIRHYSSNPYGQYLGWGYTGSTPWHIKDANSGYVFASGSYTQPEIYSNTGEAVRASGSFQVKHNEDGTWSSNINFSAYIYTAQTNTNASISLPKIDRLAKLTSYPSSLTDYDTTITFSYDNPANFKIKPYLMVKQESSIGYEYTEYIDENPFSWNWLKTAEDRERLYSTVRTSTKATVSLRLRTYNNKDELLGITAVDIPFELVEAEPFVELETEELNENVKDVVSGELIAVNYVSQIKATATFSGGKGSTLKKIRIAGVESDTSPFTTTVKVESEVPSTIYGVVASVEDSRTLTDGDEVIYQLVDYRPVNINTYKFKRENPTSDQIFLDADITYWGVTVNGVENTVIISYSTDGESYTVIPPEAYVINEENKKITISRYAVPTKLNYKEQGTYYLRIVDMFTDDNENEIVTKGIPTTEKGEHDFQVNGDLIICDEDRENPVNVRDMLGATPIGQITDFAGDNIPDGWMICDGRELPIADYEELYNVIGTTYGDGDGRTTFNIPNIKGRVVVGKDESNSSFNGLGKTGGESAVTLTHDTIPYHAHNQNALSGYGYPNNWVGNDAQISDEKIKSYTTGGYVNTNAWTAKTGYQNQTLATGGGKAHNNLQPYIVLYKIIKVSNNTSSISKTSQAKVIDNLDGNSTTDAPSVRAVKDAISKQNKMNDATVLCDKASVNYFTPLAGSGHAFYGNCYYYKNGTRVLVHIGIGGMPNANTRIFTLPVGYRPLTTTGGVSTADMTNHFAGWEVLTDGTVNINTSYGYMLANIEFDAFN